MAEISERSAVQIPAMCIPSFRTQLAIQRKVERNLLIKTWGGLGDQICAEPTLRFALDTFKDCRVTLASEMPELFRHLPFYEVIDTRKVQPIWENYLCFNTIEPPTSLMWEFMSHMLVNCVDYPALCAFRCQLPVSYREVQTPQDPLPLDVIDAVFDQTGWKPVAIHAGKHWQSKTFPKEWWDEVIFLLAQRDFRPVLIGADSDDNRGTVDVNTDRCIDLRNKLSVLQTVHLLRLTPVLITNDSSPLHMAASKDPVTGRSSSTKIGYIATCKHPDYLTHWRRGKWGWGMENLSRGGIWEVLDYCPNKEQEVSAENVGDLLSDWLPEPRAVVEWVERQSGLTPKAEPCGLVL